MDKRSFSGFSFGSSTVFTAAATSAKPTTSTAVDTKDVLTTLTTSTSSTNQTSRPFFGPAEPQDNERHMDSEKIGLKFQAVRPATGRDARVSSADQTAAQPCTFIGFERMLESEWRDVEWTEEKRTSLMKSVSSYKPSCEGVTQARVLLLGPVGSGKSSFISSVQSVFTGRVTNRAMVGSSTTSFTKKLQSFNIRGQKGEDPTNLKLCDVMGLGDKEMTGMTLHDILSIIKGHVPEGHKFRPDQPVRSETVGYVKKPTLKDRVHCVAFVVDASKIPTYPKGLRNTFQQLREHISDLGVHQVALLTHIDQIAPKTAKDVSQVYKSCAIQEMMDKAGALLGMSTSYIVPVKNYSSELDVDVNTDVLLLSAVDHILQYADLFFQDNTPQCAGSVTYGDWD